MAYDYGFASVYDRFTENAEPQKRGRWARDLLRMHGITGGILLDLACGTGKITEAYVNAGFDVIGADLSEDMLDLARERFAASGADVLLLNQDMRELDLFGTVNACVCTFKSKPVIKMNIGNYGDRKLFFKSSYQFYRIFIRHGAPDYLTACRLKP